MCYTRMEPFGVPRFELGLNPPKGLVLPLHYTPLNGILSEFSLLVNLLICYTEIMNFRSILGQLNIASRCRKYGLSLWQCPQFLFLIMGIFIIASTLIIYAVGSKYIEDPEIIALVVILITAILFIIAAVITNSFERLAEANRMKSEFVSVVSHQLRSPLSNLKWAVDFLMSGRMKEVSKKQMEYFKILKENSARMAELISDLLIVSRIEQKKFPLKKESFVMTNLVKEVMRGVSIFARASNVEIKIDIKDNLPEILADPSQLRLVVENLLDNAIRYVKAKGKVEVRLEKQNKSIYFEVKDNGVGIPKEDQKYIFQRFFRSANVMRHQTEGSGLGLYIAKSIVEKSGGKIGFESQENKGSTFWFTIPIK